MPYLGIENSLATSNYQGLYLKDLTVLDETHQTFEEGLINFKKMTIVAKFLDSFVACQNLGYTFDYNGELQHYILNDRIVLGEKQLYTQSKFIEPPGEKIKKSTAIMDQVIAYSQMGIPSNVNLPKFRNWW